MKKLLVTIALTVAAVSINAQTVPQFNSEDEVYMYAKYNNDTLLWSIYNGTKTEVNTSMNFASQCAVIEAPYKAGLEARISHLEDSLGVSRKDAAGTPNMYKIYNPNVDTAKVLVFLGLQDQIQQKYNSDIRTATEGIRAEYDNLFEQALLNAVNRYYQNTQRTLNQ
jgi:hypothetical protein